MNWSKENPMGQRFPFWKQLGASCEAMATTTEKGLIVEGLK